MNKLMILTTGGTIDKVYFDAASEFQIGAPVIEALLERMNVGFEVSLNQLMRFLTSAVLSARYKQ
jgi:L-asparaginase|tara:strand:+ start:1139 stop:1333 length:195 start_codon:yes stop_codon:yes gene_type:complete